PAAPSRVSPPVGAPRRPMVADSTAPARRGRAETAAGEAPRLPTAGPARAEVGREDLDRTRFGSPGPAAPPQQRRAVPAGGVTGATGPAGTGIRPAGPR